MRLQLDTARRLKSGGECEAPGRIVGAMFSNLSDFFIVREQKRTISAI